jgi:dienelactone hydrolase
MIDDLRRRVEAHFRRQEREKASLTTIEAFEAHRARVRAHFMEAIGGVPTERTPLSPQITGAIDRGNFVIEKLIYESLPEFFVTAALYVPKNVRAPAPAVVFVHGHSDLGKSYPVYQSVCVDLAENGFVVLAVDPPGQGERFQYFDAETGRRIIGGCTTEHTHAGLQFFLNGASVGRHFIWDVVRGVDYLETRPEVDATRIGLTGNSGGGTQSCLLMMSEPRFAAAVPCTFVMTLESYMKTGQAQDAEQIVPGCMVHGPDHDDFLTAMAPKPVLVGAAAYDYFPIEGAMEAVRRAKNIYALYGKEDNVDIAIAPTRHGYSPQLREACVNWFKRHLRGEEPNFKTGTPDTLPESELWATPKGQVLDAYPGSKTVFDLNRKAVNSKQLAVNSEQLRQTVVEVLGIEMEKRAPPIYPRIIHESVVEGYPVEKVFFFSEPNVVVTGVIIHPRNAQPVEQTDLVLLENGTNDIPDERARWESLLRKNHRVFVFDVRGVGAVASRPVNRGSVSDAYNSEYKLGCDAMMLGISTVGLRVFDVLRAYDYLSKIQNPESKIGLYGIGSGATFAYFAAALEDGFAELTFEDMLYSYRHLCETRYYNRRLYNLKTMAYGILKRFDLPNLLRCLAPRPTRFIHPRNAYGEALPAKEFEKQFIATAGELPQGWKPKCA